MTETKPDQSTQAGIVVFLILGAIVAIYFVRKDHQQQQFVDDVSPIFQEMSSARRGAEQRVVALKGDRAAFNWQQYDWAKSRYDEVERRINASIDGLIFAMRSDSYDINRCIQNLDQGIALAQDFMDAIDRMRFENHGGPTSQNAPPVGGGPSSPSNSKTIIDVASSIAKAYNEAQIARRDEIIKSLNEQKWKPFDQVQ